MRLRTMINELDALVATRYWFCVWCQSHYQGEKHCKTVQHGDIQHQPRRLGLESQPEKRYRLEFSLVSVSPDKKI
ncbi:zinc-ribbon domain-containing protein [Klebsiella pneumoniae]